VRPHQGVEIATVELLQSVRTRFGFSAQVLRAEATYDGARYRVRTCDPYRVKVVLYH
jgi:hypothetical protein